MTELILGDHVIVANVEIGSHNVPIIARFKGGAFSKWIIIAFGSSIASDS